MVSRESPDALHSSRCKGRQWDQGVESLPAEDDGVQSFLETPVLQLVKDLSGENSGESILGSAPRGLAFR